MAGSRYAADPSGDVSIVALDGLVALFHAPSGTTHIVSPPVPQILEALAEGPADAAAILERIRTRYEVEEDAPAGLIEARLDELEAVGLVRRG